jgi:hypothetical protein
MKVIHLSALHRPPLPPGSITGSNFSQRLSRLQGHSAAGRIMSLKNCSDTMGIRTRDLPAFSAVPQTTASPRGALVWIMLMSKDLAGGTLRLGYKTRSVQLMPYSRGCQTRNIKFHICGSVHRQYNLLINQLDAALSSLIYSLLRVHSTSLGCSLHPSSGVQLKL